MSDDDPVALRFDILCGRRPGLTRDLPPGKEDLQWVVNTATLIYDDTDAVLVDTFTTVDQNQELVDWVEGYGRNLKYIYITHGHGDHFFGVKQLKEAFPAARAIATAAAAKQAAYEGSPEYLDIFWGKAFPGQIPTPPVAPEALDGDRFEMNGHTFQVIETGYTDTHDTSALWVPELRLVVAGDVAYNGIHQYMAETTTESREEWARATDILAALDPRYVVAGHKIPSNSDDPKILAETKQYLTDFNRLDATTGTAGELYEAMLQLYPDRANPGSLWGGAKKAKS
ncbi:MBL fold metallo-hydrolase [Nocardia sp. NPDC020380]|uniref:MBL fold metallo-hydrolase n=1 Tax=Nocardia sp. NPDC020380 TaxID=3364309 RepID=UPI00378DC4AB